MKLSKALSSFFIPKQHINSPVDYRKSLILTWSHILLYVIVIGTLSIGNSILETTLTHLYFWIILLVIPFSFFMFKKWGNLTFSGNFVASTWYLIVTSQITSTGGVFSDNIMWLVGVPFMAFLVLDKRWGLFWMILMYGTFVCVFIYGKSHPEINKFVDNDDYFFLSYSALSFVFFGFLFIFEKSQSTVLKELAEKNRLLETQNILLENQNLLLVEQKKEISTQTEALKLKDEKLSKSNHELQNFAYAASHDLKEPLRMIGMYTQLLQKRIKSTLDERSVEYMFYMTDGVKRMQKLLDDLLTYSRLGKNEEDIQDIDLNKTLLFVTQNLTVVIKDTNALVSGSNLPTIRASSTEMMQLFQNLMANALKFRKEGIVPEICIESHENNKEYTISLSDNGIGIKQAYQEKVFDIFTKLHSSSQYEGSGIGLATCKKIVEELGGRMWLTSTEGVGTTFYFTFPKKHASKIEVTTEKREVTDFIDLHLITV
jgi:signal transduction histidine kinase